jgi:membrane protease YdiL (CAAX protease family)
VGGAIEESKPELGTWKFELSSVSIRLVPRALQSDVLKILAYVVAAMLLGALLAPWLYTAGKALAEVTQGADVAQRKETNGFIEWLASACRNAEFPRFFNRSLMISALVLLIPLVQWLRMERGKPAYRDTPWSLRLPEAAIAANEGQPLKRNHRGPGQLCFGFLVASSGLLLLGLALVSAEVFVWRSSSLPNGATFPPINGWKVVRSAMGPAVVVSIIEEIVFRGVLLGLFMRAMRAWPAILSVSLLFAFVHFLQPRSGVVVPDPESPTAGLWLIGQIFMRFTQPLDLIAGFATLTAVGAVLAYARWRTASLWLPVGLHAGWIFGIAVFKAITWVAPGVSPAAKFLVGSTLREGLIPLVVVVLTGVAVHGFTKNPGCGNRPAN